MSCSMYKYFILYFKKIIFVSPYKYTRMLSSLPTDLVVIKYVFAKHYFGAFNGVTSFIL